MRNATLFETKIQTHTHTQNCIFIAIIANERDLTLPKFDGSNRSVLRFIGERIGVKRGTGNRPGGSRLAAGRRDRFDVPFGFIASGSFVTGFMRASMKIDS